MGYLATEANEEEIVSICSVENDLLIVAEVTPLENSEFERNEKNFKVFVVSDSWAGNKIKELLEEKGFSCEWL